VPTDPSLSPAAPDETVVMRRTCASPHSVEKSNGQSRTIEVNGTTWNADETESRMSSSATTGWMKPALLPSGYTDGRTLHVGVHTLGYPAIPKKPECSLDDRTVDWCGCSCDC
jgi:hypothetical protein